MLKKLKNCVYNPYVHIMDMQCDKYSIYHNQFASIDWKNGQGLFSTLTSM